MTILYCLSLFRNLCNNVNILSQTDKATIEQWEKQIKRYNYYTNYNSNESY